MAEKAILVDTTTCIGCRGCQVACKMWNNNPAAPWKKAQEWKKQKFLEPDFFAGPGYQNPGDLNFLNFRVVKFFTDQGVADPTTGDDVDKYGNWNFLSFSCQHCSEPNCLAACPFGAICIDDDGFVQIIKGKCKPDKCQSGGKPSCVGACLFREAGDPTSGVPQVGRTPRKPSKRPPHWQKYYARKCHGCYNRRGYLKQCGTAGAVSDQYPAGIKDPASSWLFGPGLAPACVTACPVDALNYGDRTAMISLANARAADPDVIAKFPEVNVYGATKPFGGLHVISVLTRDPRFYGLPVFG